MAEEFALDSRIQIHNLRRSNLRSLGWQRPPTISFTGAMQMAISNGDAVLPIYPDPILLNGIQINIPPLPSSGSLVRQEDRLFLVGFAAEVGAAQDSNLGLVNFQYRDASQQITTIQKENARRIRAFWILVMGADDLTESLLRAQLPTIGTSGRKLVISSIDANGFVSGNLRFFSFDPSLLASKEYILEEGSVDILPLCRIRRLQNFQDRGYTWGLSGESPLDVKFNVLPSGAIVQPDSLDSMIRERTNQIFAGKPGQRSAYARTVQNLSAGAVATNPGRAGESAGSPNGSVCLANDQRVSFSNQALLGTRAVQRVVASSDSAGNAIVVASLNTNVPIGTFFSPRKEDHKIYTLNGTEESELGNFSNLGGSGGLTWIADANSSIRPGHEILFVPAVQFPSGSGFNIPFEACEAIWVDGVPLPIENIRNGETSDLDAYEAPTGGSNFIAVMGRERCALHYIYKKVSITTTATGVAIIPSSERGSFAFIEGVTGRIDSPIYTGLSPNATYNALVYYPPRSLESWQFQLRYAEYQGTGALEPGFLNGARVISRPFFYLHTQGGGGSVFQGDAATRYSPIAFHLPAIATGIPSYRLNAPIQFVGESYPGPVTLRETLPISGAGLTLPNPGQVLSLQSNAGVPPRSIAAQLLADGQPLGFRVPALSNGFEYQAVLVFAVEKAGERRLVVVSRTTAGNEDIPASSTIAAIDTYRI